VRRIFLLSIILLSVAVIAQNPWTETYIHDLRFDSEATKQTDPLYVEITEKAEKYKILPQDAKIDRVWKAMPGYNGLKVDIEASYKNMKKLGEFSTDQLVYQQISPNIHLSDLPPAPIYRGHPDKPMVAFLINVAWGNEYIPDMLNILKKHRVKATFFLEGRWVKQNPEMAKMIVDAGHEIGNHSYNHPDLKVMNNDDIREQLVKTNEIIEATTGVKCRWLAPPSGSYRDDVVNIAHELEMSTIMWSVDTIDWQKPAPSVIVERVVSKIHNGALILMHPTLPTAQALDSLIASIKQKGYEFGNVSTLLNEERIVKK
jgi:probable sporulation protein (polysaccharide deacetylase family)